MNILEPTDGSPRLKPKGEQEDQRHIYTETGEGMIVVPFLIEINVCVCESVCLSGGEDAVRRRNLIGV